MAITIEFDPPLPSDSPAVFNSKAFTLLGDLNTWSDEANAVQADVNAKQTTASAAAVTATSAKDAAEAALDSFDDRYLGAKSSNPTLDNDGNALLTGALYWNTTAAEMRVWTGSAWTALNATTGIAQAIEVNSSTTALRVRQTGSGNAFVVEDAASDTTPFVIDASGQVVVGHTASLANTALEVINSVSRFSYTANAFAGSFSQRKSRSATVGARAIVQSGDELGNFYFYGDDGSADQLAARIAAFVDGTPGLSDMPGRLVISTTPDGSATPIEALRIDSAQQVGIGGASTAGYIITVNKAITSNANAIGMRVNSVVQSDVTNSAAIFSTRPGTAAAAFTLPNLYHYITDTQTFGAGSSVTNQYGFFANSTLTGAANNYGFYSNISAATGRWNFYAAGSAENYFAGKTTLGGISGNDVIVGSAALATTATAGFMWIPSCPGAPTGAPTSPYTNAAALVVDTTNNRLYARVGATWRYATLT